MFHRILSQVRNLKEWTLHVRYEGIHSALAGILCRPLYKLTLIYMNYFKYTLVISTDYSMLHIPAILRIFEYRVAYALFHSYITQYFTL